VLFFCDDVEKPETVVNRGDQVDLQCVLPVSGGGCFFYPTFSVLRFAGENVGDVWFVNKFYGAEYCFCRE